MTDTKFTEISEPIARFGAAKRGVFLSHALLSIAYALGDILVISVLFLAAHTFHTLVVGVGIFDPTDAILSGLRFATIFAAIVLIRGNYEFGRLLEPEGQLRRFAQSWMLTFLVFAWFAFLEKNAADFSRGSVLIFWVSGGVVLYGFRKSAANWLRARLESNEINLASAFVVYDGSEWSGPKLSAQLRSGGIEIVGQFETHSTLSDTKEGHVPEAVLSAIMACLQSKRLDAVYLFLSWQNWQEINSLKSVLQQLPVPVYLFADPVVQPSLASRRQTVAGNLAFQIERGPLTENEQLAKRLTDIAAATLGLLVLSPLIIMAAIAVKLSSPGPVLFRQRRKGFGGKPFDIYKFRTMTVEENGDEVKQASRNDNRVTRIGRILRRSSIDELPQLLNVLKGDMSMVGPRPHAVAHDNLYDRKIGAYAFRQHVKPGLTGWAQIHGLRGETATDVLMAKRVEHDLWYINNWSWLLDLQIMLRTAVVLLWDKNAY